MNSVLIFVITCRNGKFVSFLLVCMPRSSTDSFLDFILHVRIFSQECEECELEYKEIQDIINIANQLAEHARLGMCTL